MFINFNVFTLIKLHFAFMFIAAPSTISIILDAVRPFLSRTTNDAFRIFSANRAKWMPYLDERIDKTERRAQYGGVKPPVKY